MIRLLTMRLGRITYVSDNMNPWLKQLLKGSRFDIENLRKAP